MSKPSVIQIRRRIVDDGPPDGPTAHYDFQKDGKPYELVIRADVESPEQLHLADERAKSTFEYVMKEACIVEPEEATA